MRRATPGEGAKAEASLPVDAYDMRATGHDEPLVAGINVKYMLAGLGAFCECRLVRMELAEQHAQQRHVLDGVVLRAGEGTDGTAERTVVLMPVRL